MKDLDREKVRDFLVEHNFTLEEAIDYLQKEIDRLKTEASK